MSAIRIVDLFTVSIRPDIPLERQAVGMQLLVMARFEPGNHTAHSFKLHLHRPDGSIDPFGDSMPTPPLSNEPHPGQPTGVNFAITLQIIPKQMGTHFIRVEIDGDLVATVPFTLAERKPETESQS